MCSCVPHSGIVEWTEHYLLALLWLYTCTPCHQRDITQDILALGRHTSGVVSWRPILEESTQCGKADLLLSSEDYFSRGAELRPVSSARAVYEVKIDQINLM